MEEQLYLDAEGPVLPLHTSIALFLMSYCDCKTWKIYLVLPDSSTDNLSENILLPRNLEAETICKWDLPPLVRSCRLPAVVEASGTFCRAGLAVVLRHIIHKAHISEPFRNDIVELLGFKKTCLKACAEVSQWTRLCEISIPRAIESFLKKPSANIPTEVLQFEKKLGEPVKVHNDDKIRRQKLQQQMTANKNDVADSKSKAAEAMPCINIIPNQTSLELGAALSKLTVQGALSCATREPSHIRKAKNSDLPPLEHVFAEGLYFTLTDVVLLPCIHAFLVALSKVAEEKYTQIPLIAGWYRRVQQVPGVRWAASMCSITFLDILCENAKPQEQPSNLHSETEEKEIQDSHFVGGPRPTMTKLKEFGIEAIFSSHPCPSWTIDWKSLPAAASPAEGKMSSERAVRKQQQLNNLLSVVTNIAKPGDTIVDFCSGGVILIENKEESLLRAKDRCYELGLTNIWFIQANLDYFTGSFTIGVALHACGVATDMVMEHCIKARAAFVVSPCCYGFIQNTVKTRFPRSCRFQEALTYKEHMILCRFADQTAVQLTAERRQIGKQCMGLVDLDRAWAAEQSEYKVQVITMEPESCSPKNNMIVGSPI
uniref:Glutathione S-transferase C-terminal domain-containing protein n=1 Tax=Xenopus tropicalis TaxID=8364 RepID=F6PV16_XENTR